MVRMSGRADRVPYPSDAETVSVTSIELIVESDARTLTTPVVDATLN
jgi:hypothetical protein